MIEVAIVPAVLTFSAPCPLHRPPRSLDAAVYAAVYAVMAWMNTLSDELLCCIFGYADTCARLVSVQFVSKRLRRIALENQFWYYAISSASAREAIHDPLYAHWTEVDWLNEWKWYCAFQSRNGELTVLGAMCPYESSGLMPTQTF